MASACDYTSMSSVQSGPCGKRMPVVAPDALAQRIDKSASSVLVRPLMVGVVRHQEVAVHEKDVGRNAAEAKVQGVEERPGTRVVVVRVRVHERDEAGQRARDAGAGPVDARTTRCG